MVSFCGAGAGTCHQLGIRRWRVRARNGLLTPASVWGQPRRWRAGAAPRCWRRGATHLAANYKIVHCKQASLSLSLSPSACKQKTLSLHFFHSPPQKQKDDLPAMLLAPLATLTSLAGLCLAAPAPADRPLGLDVAKRGGLHEPVIHKVTVGKLTGSWWWACPSIAKRRLTGLQPGVLTDLQARIGCCSTTPSLCTPTRETSSCLSTCKWNFPWKLRKLRKLRSTASSAC